MNVRNLAWFILAIAIVFLAVGPVTADTATTEELYKRAEQKYLQFQTEKAVDLLMRVLHKKPTHERARELLDEMGRTPPSVKSLRSSGADTATETDTGDRETREDTPTSRPSPRPSRTRADTTGNPKPDTSPDHQTTVDTTTVTDTDGNVSKESTPRTESDEKEPQPAHKTSVDTTAETERTKTNSQQIIVPDQPTSRTEAAPAPPVVPPGSKPSSGSQNADTGGSGSSLISPQLDTGSGTVAGNTTHSGNSGQNLQPVIRVSGASDTQDSQTKRKTTDEENYRPNLNTVSKRRLADGVNSQIADRIVSERRSNGFFLSWTDFRDRVSAGADTFRAIRKQFTLAIPVVDVNSASVNKLSGLPYMTRKIAENIVNFRFTYGSFSSVGQLTDVPGITKSSLKRVKPYLEAR